MATQQEASVRALGRVLGLVFLLNLLDTGFTMFWVETGLGSEANPLLRRLAHEDWGLFLLVKIVLVGFGLWVLWNFRSSKLVEAGLRVVLTVYLGVVLYHSGIMVGLALVPAF